MMTGRGCAACHGADGRGGVLRGPRRTLIEAPDIRYEALTRPAHGWTDADIARAIREGVDPEGERLDPAMPRWSMTDGEVGEVIGYLEELSAR